MLCQPKKLKRTPETLARRFKISSEESDADSIRWLRRRREGSYVSPMEAERLAWPILRLRIRRSVELLRSVVSGAA